MEEFFQLTCKSIILNSPHMNSIRTVSTSKLYMKAVKSQVPFFKWASWIEESINKELMRVLLRSGGKAAKSTKAFKTI